jgi:hypothetical protein
MHVEADKTFLGSVQGNEIGSLIQLFQLRLRYDNVIV